jgi:hypothetical protein
MAEAGVPELSRLFSLEPFPLKPVLDPKNVDKSYNNLRKYNEDLERYLRRLSAHLQTINSNLVTYVNNTINVAISGVSSGSGFVKVVEKTFTYTGTDNVTYVLDSTIDWRETAIIGHQRLTDSGDTYDTFQHFIDDSNAPADTSPGTNNPGFYPKLLLTAINSSSTANVKTWIDGTDGHLYMVLTNNSSVHRTYYVYVYIAAYAKVPASSTAISIGNGL